MEFIVSDSSIIIDLCKANLIESMLRLEHRFIIPETMLYGELLQVGSYDIKALVSLGIEPHVLNEQAVALSTVYAVKYPALSQQDSFALALASSIGCLLLTGDKRMRLAAQENNISVHGVLWVCDEIYSNSLASVKHLHTALNFFKDDPFVRLPENEITQRLKRYK